MIKAKLREGRQGSASDINGLLYKNLSRTNDKSKNNGRDIREMMQAFRNGNRILKDFIVTDFHPRKL